MLEKGVEGNCGNFGELNSFHSFAPDYGRNRIKKEDFGGHERAFHEIWDPECEHG